MKIYLTANSAAQPLAQSGNQSDEAFELPTGDSDPPQPPTPGPENMTSPKASQKEPRKLSPAMVRYLGQTPMEGGSTWEIMQEFRDVLEGIGASHGAQ